MIRIIATLCHLASPYDCTEKVVTTDAFQPLTLLDCANQAALADWMKSFPQYRIANVRCEWGKRGERV